MSKQKTPEDRLVTNKEIAKEFNVSISTVKLWRPKLPAYVAGNVRWLSEVRQAVAEIQGYGSQNRIFTKEQVINIYKRSEKGESQTQIGNGLGASPSTISRILSGEHYGEIWQEYHQRKD